jgi:hypothetical protein
LSTIDKSHEENVASVIKMYWVVAFCTIIKPREVCLSFLRCRWSALDVLNFPAYRALLLQGIRISGEQGDRERNVRMNSVGYKELAGRRPKSTTNPRLPGVGKRSDGEDNFWLISNAIWANFHALAVGD